MSVEKSTVDIDTQKLTPSWREKHQAQHMRPPLKLGRLEQKLLELLTTGPATRDELIAQMYDLTSNPFALENRFHVLMNRVKRKVPGAVIFDGTYYRLIDDSPLTSLLRA